MKRPDESVRQMQRSWVMRSGSHRLLIGCVLSIVLGSGAAPAIAAQKKPAAKRPAPRPAAERPVDMTALQTQVMLDRAGFSPGEIDGAMGSSTARALQAY